MSFFPRTLAELAEDLTESDPDKGSLQGGFTTVGALVAGGGALAIADSLTNHRVHLHQGTTMQPASHEVHNIPVDVVSAIGGAALAGAAIFMAIRRFAISHLGIQQYKELKH